MQVKWPQHLAQYCKLYRSILSTVVPSRIRLSAQVTAALTKTCALSVLWRRRVFANRTPCTLVAVFFTLVAGLLARSQYSEGPATGHIDTAFSWFPCAYKQMLRRFPRNCTQYSLAWVFLPFVHAVFQFVSCVLLLVLSCLVCNCCWLVVCIVVVILCVFVVLCVYCCFYFRCRTAG